MGTFVNLLGQRLGKLVVIERMPNNKRKQAVWKCKCDCGTTVIVESGHLRSGHTQSCGCFGRQRAAEYHIKHGMKGTKLFSVYHSIKGRCYTPTDKKYYRYGARGIRVCDEWLNKPESFFKWALENGYKEGLSIDRIDNNGDYCPDNCRWTDAKTQANNRSNTVYYEYQGMRKTISEWANYLGISYSAVKSRIKRGNFESCFNTQNGNLTLVTYNGTTKSIKDWAVYLNMNYSTIRARVRRGTFEKLFSNQKNMRYE